MGENTAIQCDSKIHLRGRPKDGRHPNFKGGRVIAAHGYVLIFVGKHHHLADVRGYAYEHRIIAERKIGRRLLPNEVVHHLDEDKSNNSPDNLEVKIDNGVHLHEHGRLINRHPHEDNSEILCACGCGGVLLKYDQNNRPRKFIHGHNMKKNGR